MLVWLIICIAIVSEEYCQEHNIQPIAEIIGSAFIGCDPQKMGLGPYYAIDKLLNDVNLEFGDIEFFEINEAFAAQTLGCFKLMAEKYGVNVEDIINKTNLRGSGLGLGHPLGATGVRITTTLAYLMKSKPKSYGISSLCIGGGMGAAVLLKNL